MVRTWFSYVVLVIGLMMLFASDRSSIAEDVAFGTEKEIQIFVNKQGDEDSRVNIEINGKKIEFDLPKLADGESKTMTLDDGTEVVIKAVSGHNNIWIDGEELSLPVMGMKGHSEGLHTMISRVAPTMMHFGHDKNSVVINADVPEDAVAAIKSAVKDVLVSYGIDKKVVIRKAPKMEFITIDGDDMDGKKIELLQEHDIDVKVIKGGKEGAIHKIEVIKKEKKDGGN